MRNKKAVVMIQSDSSGNERALKEMNFETWQAYLVPEITDMASIPGSHHD